MNAGGGFGFLKTLASTAASSLRDIAASGLQVVKQQKDYFTGEASTQANGGLTEANIREKLASQNEIEVFEGLKAIMGVRSQCDY